jgi:hypothetical protein
VIVNEQINGLNYDKPRSRGGGPEWPGYRKSNEYDGKKSCYYYFEVKRKNGNKSKQWKQWKQKQLKRFKCCKRCKWEARGLFAQSKKGKVVKDAKDEWIERQNLLRGKTSSLGRTELGRLVAASGGQINGTTLQIPTTGYHTASETASLTSIAAAIGLLCTFIR